MTKGPGNRAFSFSGEERAKLRRIHRLQDMRVEARVERASAIVRLPVARQRDELHVPRPGGAVAPDASRDLVAVEPRKTDVDDGDVGPRLSRAIEPFGAAAREESLVLPRAEEHSQGLARIGSIFDDEHALGPQLARRSL